MSANEIAAKVQELRELRRMADELAAEIDGLQDAIKQHADQPELYAKYTKQTTARRFCLV